VIRHIKRLSDEAVESVREVSFSMDNQVRHENSGLDGFEGNGLV
jgi:hypothetical protein